MLAIAGGVAPVAAQPQRAALMGLWERSLKQYEAGNYDAAEATARRSLELASQWFGPDHRAVGRGHFELARVQLRVGRLTQGEGGARRALAIWQREFGADTPQAAAASTMLGAALVLQNRIAEGEAHLLRARSILQRHPPLRPQQRGENERWLGVAYLMKEDYDRSEQHLREALQRQRQATGPNSIYTARAHHWIGRLHFQRGRMAQAEAAYLASVDAYDKSIARNGSELADTLDFLARVYVWQGRESEAEAIYRRALAIQRTAYRGAQANPARTATALGTLYLQQGRLDEAEALLSEAHTTFARTVGDANPGAYNALVNFAALLIQRQRYAEVEPLLQRAIEGRRRATRDGQVAAYGARLQLGRLHLARGELAAAEQALKAGLDEVERVQGSDHPQAVRLLASLSDAHARAGRQSQSAESLRRAADILSRRLDASAGIGAGADEVGPVQRQLIFGKVLERAWQDRERGSAARFTIGDALIAAQRLSASTAGSAVAQMSSRLAAGNGALAGQLRRLQDLSQERAALEIRLSQIIGDEGARTDDGGAGDRTPGERARAWEMVGRLSREIAGIEQQLKRDHPDFVSLIERGPIGITEVQPLLSDGEALVVAHVAAQHTYVWAITRKEAVWHRSELPRETLSQQLEVLRCGLEAEAWLVAERRERCRALGVRVTSAELPFDRDAAHQLYLRLLEPLSPQIAGKSLMLVVDGPLTSLPFQVLVTEPPRPGAAMAETSWLIRRHALSILPSVSSLRMLRAASFTPAAQPFIGYGAPEFGREREQPPTKSRGAKPVAVAATSGARVQVTRGVSTYFRGQRANLDALRTGLTPLPETSDELKSVASMLAAEPTSVVVGRAATEANVKAARLDAYRVVYFATHGLVAGEIQGLAEPALALTLPLTASEADDGLLTASEIATLKLNADWVVLSACNTAAGNAPGAEALSGLASAFLYAGARSLLVTHYRVLSEAAVKLTTGTFEALTGTTGRSRREALQHAMLGLAGSSSKEQAHPAYWAPFILVGDGR